MAEDRIGAELASLPNGLSSALRSRGKQKALPVSKRKLPIPKASRKAQQGRGRSRSSMACSDSTASQDAEPVSASAAAASAQQHGEDPALVRVHSFLAASEDAGATDTAVLSSRAEPAVEPGQSRLRLSGEDLMPEASATRGRSRDRATTMDPEGTSGDFANEQNKVEKQENDEDQPFLQANAVELELRWPASGERPRRRAPELYTRWLLQPATQWKN